MQSMKRSYKSTRMTFIFAILGPNHRVKLGDGAAQLHKFRPRSHSSCRARLKTLSRAFLRPLISNSSRVRRKGLGTRLHSMCMSVCEHVCMPACAHACADVSVWVTRGEHSQHGTPWCVLIVFVPWLGLTTMEIAVVY